MKQTSKMLTTLAENYGFSVDTPKQVLEMKVSGMTFHICSFTAPGLGHVSEMTASGFFGLMQMDTLIITPTEVDMPLFSYDRVMAMGNDTLIFELYDTMLDQSDLSAIDAVKKSAMLLQDHDLGSHWYDSIKLPQSLSKKGKKKDTPVFDQLATDYFAAYLYAAKAAVPCETKLKRQKASIYVEGLLTNGGPPTNAFKKGIGEKETAKLFRTTLFATEE